MRRLNRIENRIVRVINEGVLTERDEIIADVALEEGVTTFFAAKVFDEIEEEGIIETHVGSGEYMTEYESGA